LRRMRLYAGMLDKYRASSDLSAVPIPRSGGGNPMAAMLLSLSRNSQPSRAGSKGNWHGHLALRFLNELFDLAFSPLCIGRL
jgi:hypothetical protein